MCVKERHDPFIMHVLGIDHIDPAMYQYFGSSDWTIIEYWSCLFARLAWLILFEQLGMGGY